MADVILYWCFFLVMMEVDARRHVNNDDGKIVFPGPIRDPRMSTVRPGRYTPGYFRRKDNITQLPIDLVRELNQVTDLQDISHLITNKEEFIRSIQDESSVKLTSRFGLDESAVISTTYTKLPECIPESSLIHLPNESNGLLYPSCVRVDRCSGCCNHPVLECKAIKTEKHSYKISVMELDIINNKSYLKFKEWQTFEIEKHTKCACNCKIKITDCNAGQIYQPDQCLCECPNKKAERSCRSYEEAYDDRYWDEEQCTCVCRESPECSTGAKFNTNSCRCVRDDPY